MKTFLAIISLCAASAFAGESNEESVFNYTFFGNTSGRYTMVSCDYAEYVAETAIEKLGATKVATYCSGGITPVGIWPLNLRITYTAPVLTGPTHEESVKLESESNSHCDFDTGFIGALLRDFPNAKLNRRNDFCFRADSAYEYDLSVKLPN